MYKFFTQKKWFKWSILGSLFILISTWYQVQLDVKINEWFGDFYDTLQKALTTPNSVSETEFICYLFTFAKIAGIELCNSYRDQYKCNFISAMPTNLYGPEDNFDPSSSHVIPALILKIFQAKKNNINKIEVWGDGTPTRDFLFVDDAAQGIVDAAKYYDEDSPLNLGSSEEISIKYLVDHIAKILNYDGKIIWNTSKPNGQPRRCVSYNRAKEKINFQPKTSLIEGLEQTINWFVTSQKQSSLNI